VFCEDTSLGTGFLVLDCEGGEQWFFKSIKIGTCARGFWYAFTISGVDVSSGTGAARSHDWCPLCTGLSSLEHLARQSASAPRDSFFIGVCASWHGCGCSVEFWAWSCCCQFRADFWIEASLDEEIPDVNLLRGRVEHDQDAVGAHSWVVFIIDTDQTIDALTFHCGLGWLITSDQSVLDAVHLLHDEVDDVDDWHGRALDLDEEGEGARIWHGADEVGAGTHEGEWGTGVVCG